jgi:hypothetical protein
MNAADYKFSEFVSNHSPAQVSRHLRSVLLGYIEGQLDTGLPADFHIYLWEFNDLFDLLDRAMMKGIKPGRSCHESRPLLRKKR